MKDKVSTLKDEKLVTRNSGDKLTAWFNRRVASDLEFKRHPYSVNFETRKKYIQHGVMI